MMRPSLFKRILQIIFLVSLAFCLLINHFDKSNPWGSWYYDPGPWCEQERTDSWVREPSNSFIDFAFLAVSLYLLGKFYEDLKTDSYQQMSGYSNAILQNPGLTFLGFLMHFIHFLGTFGNHACRCHPGHMLDVIGMYGIALYPGLIWAVQVYVMKKRNNNGKLTEKDWIFICMILLAIYSYFIWSSDNYYSNPIWETYEVSTMFILVGFALWMDRTVRTSFKAQFQTKKFGAAVILLAVAFIAHRCDMERVFCYPESLLQGHAIWHLASSYAVYIMYQYQRTAKIEGIKEK